MLTKLLLFCNKHKSNLVFYDKMAVFFWRKQMEEEPKMT